MRSIWPSSISPACSASSASASRLGFRRADASTIRRLHQAPHDDFGQLAGFQAFWIFGVRPGPTPRLRRLDGEQFALRRGFQDTVLDIETRIADGGDARLDDDVVAETG